MKTKVTGSLPEVKLMDVAQLRAKSAIGKDRLLTEHLQTFISQMNSRATLGFYSSHHEVDDTRLAIRIVDELRAIKDLAIETSYVGTKTIITTRW